MPFTESLSEQARGGCSDSEPAAAPAALRPLRRCRRAARRAGPCPTRAGGRRRRGGGGRGPRAGAPAPPPRRCRLPPQIPTFCSRYDPPPPPADAIEAARPPHAPGSVLGGGRKGSERLSLPAAGRAATYYGAQLRRVVREGGPRLPRSHLRACVRAR